MNKLLSVLTFTLLTLVSLSQDGSNDPTFNPGTGFSGLVDVVQSTSIQSDGKIIVGGNFTSFNGTARNYIARLNEDGSLDASFNPGTGFNASVSSTSIQSDGKIIVGGLFTSFNGTARNHIARLNTDGSLDASFNPGTGFDGYVYSTSIQSDGKIIVGGSFTSFNGTTRNCIARLNTNGSLDASLNPETVFDLQVLSISLQSDGKIIVGGIYGGILTASKITRLNANGSQDTSFNPTGTGVSGGFVWSTAIQNDGKIIMGGNFTSFNGTTRNGITRLNTDGSLDTSFDPAAGFDNYIYSISIQNDGKIIVGGSFTTFNGETTRNKIARLNADGSLDAAFSSATGFYGSVVYSTSIQSDGKIIVGGNFTSFNGTARNHIARLWNCLSPATGTDTITHCRPYTWINGIEYNENATATFAISNGAANSCDSIVTLNLTINSVDVSVLVNGNTLTANLSGGDYQWIDCDNNNTPIAGETAQTFTVPQSGNYYAVIVSDGTCQDTSVCISVNTIGIASLNQDEWKISPNPTSGEFTVNANQLLDNAVVEIHSIDGKLIYSTVFSGTEMNFNIGNNPQGVYLLRVDNKDTFRIIKN